MKMNKAKQNILQNLIICRLAQTAVLDPTRFILYVVKHKVVIMVASIQMKINK